MHQPLALAQSSAESVLDRLFGLLFPTVAGQGTTPDQVRDPLEAALLAVAPYADDPRPIPAAVADEFLRAIPAIQCKLVLDVQAAVAGDPAADHPDEVILCYPGFRAIMAHRIAHELHRLRIPILPRIIAEIAHSRTGIDIHPGAVIGDSFFIDHGTGVVIGQTSIVGRGVRLYQGVTLGARSLDGQDRGRKRHPTIGDRVVIYAGAVILGGQTHIGDDSIIGGGVFLTESVPPNSIVRQGRPQLEVRSALS